MNLAQDEQLATDPPVSEAQRRAMYAAREGKSTLGIPKKVGEEFVGKDMKPDDWRGLIRGLIKFFTEEQREDEHEEEDEALDAEQPRDNAGKFSSTPGGKTEYSHTSADPSHPGFRKQRALAHEHADYLKGIGHEGVKVTRRNQTFTVPGKGISASATYTTHHGQPKTQAHDSLLAMDRDLYDANGKRIIAADRLALDRSASVRTYDMDGQLHISRTPVSKANIGEYYGAEIPSSEELGLDPKRKYKLLRDPVELKKGADSSNGKQVLIKHVPVSADDHQPDITVGALGTDAEYVDPYLYNSMTIHAREGIKGIEDDTRREISMAYHYVPVMEPGMYKGEPYDGRMTDIVFNHGCLVEAGRAGADVLVMDSASNDAAWAALEAALLSLRT